MRSVQKTNISLSPVKPSGFILCHFVHFPDRNFKNNGQQCPQVPRDDHAVESGPKDIGNDQGNDCACRTKTDQFPKTVCADPETVKGYPEHGKQKIPKDKKRRDSHFRSDQEIGIVRVTLLSER
jgi:hypothetical protein